MSLRQASNQAAADQKVRQRPVSHVELSSGCRQPVVVPAVVSADATPEPPPASGVRRRMPTLCGLDGPEPGRPEVLREDVDDELARAYRREACELIAAGVFG